MQTCQSVFLGDDAREHGTNGTIRILDGIVEVHLFALFDSLGSSLDHLLVKNGSLHAQRHRRLVGIACKVKRSFFLVEQTREVENRLACLDEVGTSHDIVQTLEAEFCQVFAYLLGEEGEVVDEIFISSHEMFAQLGVLRGHTHRTSIQVTLTHHDATQYDEGCRTESKLLGTQQGHEYDVTTGLDLTIYLQTDIAAQSVADECLLRLSKSYLRRDTCEAHRTGRRSTRTTFSTRDDDEVGLGLGHTCGNRSHTALGHQFHRDGCRGVHVLQVEDQLG